MERIYDQACKFDDDQQMVGFLEDECTIMEELQEKLGRCHAKVYKIVGPCAEEGEVKASLLEVEEVRHCLENIILKAKEDFVQLLYAHEEGTLLYQRKTRK
jgi:hypothetical protein